MADFKKLNKDFAYELMAVPTCSDNEFRMSNYIIMFAIQNGIDYNVDDYGNVYLTKGVVNEGEFYPCMTAHIDTVQHKHMPYIVSGCNLEVKTRTNKDNQTILYGEGYGLGGDDKCGVLIALSVIKEVPIMKASFFRNEERGCLGSKKMDKSFFQNVGYVIGFDSPDFNRSAWAVSGKQMFSKKFYEENMKEICDKHNRTKFYSEPFTDIAEIRENFPITCMNFGSGYYNAHTDTEYIVLEEVDDCIELSLELISKLKNERYYLPANLATYSYYYNKSNKNEEYDNSEDLKFLKTLGDNTKYGSYYSRYWDDDDDDYYSKKYSNNTSYSYNKNTTSSKSKKTSLFSDEEIATFIVGKYEAYIEHIIDDVKDKCQKLGIDFDTEFKKIFEKEITF